ncbi:MAG: peptidoglycan recognition family protein [Planctomycetota bacterium]|nr:peptidoglycan recognition family protein [Planctomycetota bacterium]
MNRMIPIRYITVHHDGMDPFYGDSAAAAKERLELIRRGHRGRGWGDIGYHFIVDRGGRVWEGRSMAYQGAHVKDHNEGNIGIMCMGNFEQQAPTVAQINGLNRQLADLMSRHTVAMRNVRTHQEWASTACPGRKLQAHMDSIRRGRSIG